MVSPPDPLQNLATYLRVQRATDRQLAALYRQALRDATAQLDRIAGDGAGDLVRRDQVLASRAVLLDRTAALVRQTGDLVAAGKLEAAAAADRNAQAYDAFLMNSVRGEPAVKAYLAAHEQASRSAVDLAERRLQGAGYRTLSEQVYRTGTVAAGLVDSAVNSAVARGLSAREFAADVAHLVDPATPGGVTYAANRLARTELNNAFLARSVDQARERPWVAGMRWTLSSSHPKPDACNDYADHDDGHGVGVFGVDDVPPRPHPHCYCSVSEVETAEFNTPLTGRGRRPDQPPADPKADWLDRFFAGEYDGYIDAHTGTVGLASTPDLVQRIRASR